MTRVTLSPHQVQAGIEILRSHFDQVIIDLPHELEQATSSVLEVSDTIFFLVRQNVSALRLGAAGIGAFRDLGLDLKKVKLVLMRERTGEDVTLKQVQETFKIPICWKVPSDYSAVVTAINSGKPVVTALPRSKIAKSLRQLSDTLVHRQPERPSLTRPTSLLQFLWSPIRSSQGVK